jgi:hypothetical protein
MGDLLHYNGRPENWRQAASARQKAWRVSARENNHCAYFGCKEFPKDKHAMCEAHNKIQSARALASYHASTKPRGDDSELGRMGETKYCIEDVILELANEYED